MVYYHQEADVDFKQIEHVEHFCREQPGNVSIAFEGFSWKEFSLEKRPPKLLLSGIKFCPYCGKLLSSFPEVERLSFPVKTGKSDICQIPGCNAKITLRCKCLRGDSVCEKGHEFHSYVAHDGRVLIHPGPSAHGSCQCCLLAETSR